MPALPDGAGVGFRRMKPFCNTVEVEIALRNTPAPDGADGVAYTAACLALAGRIDDARSAIASLPRVGARAGAAGVVFDVAASDRRRRR